jgi:hypothetical protein
VGALGVAQRGQLLARLGGLGHGVWACRNSMSPSRITAARDDSAARDTVLSSSRMLPGQW